MVRATDKIASEHITLSDGSTTIDLLLCNAQGKADVRAITKAPYPRTSFKTQQGTTKYADFEPPYFQQAQSVFSGGRARENFDEDSSRFFDSYRLDTTIDEKMMLGGLDEFGYGHRDADQQMPGIANLSCAFTALKGTTAYISDDFAASASYTTGYALVIARKVGSPAGNLRLSIYDNSGGVPGTEIVGANIQAQADIFAKYVIATLSTSLTVSTTYHLVIADTSAPVAGATSYYEVARLDAVSGKKSPQGIAWSAGPAPYFRVADTEDPFTPRFYDYKGATYMACNFRDGGTPELYINGDRGSADSNSGQLSKLIDATKSWVTNEWANAYVVIVNDEGRRAEQQPWRLITGNDATSLTISPNWQITHTTATDYVIVGSNKWALISGHGLTGPVTDVAVANEFVYFAQGKNVNIRRMREYNKAGVWTVQYADESSYNRADFLEAIPKSSGGVEMWGTTNSHAYYKVGVWHADVPPLWGSLTELFQTIQDTETPWDEQSIANVTQSTDDRATKIDIAAGFTTGVIASKVIPTTDITKCTGIAFKIHSTVTTASGQLQLLLDDSTNCLTPIHTLNLPALNANEWTWVELTVAPLGGGAGASESLISIGFNLTTDLGAQTITLHGGIFGTRDPQYLSVGNSSEKITGLIGYSDQDVHDNLAPYIFKEGSVWRIINSVAQKMPLNEMEYVKNIYNGEANAVGGVFLYFAMVDGLERYFSNQLDDIGPNRDAGLPSGRQGYISALAAYPGRIFAGINAGQGSTNFSSVMQLRGDGWHEVYRGFWGGKRVFNLHFQSLPNFISRLWIGIGTDVVAVPVTLNPFNHPNYYYWPEGWVETGWFFANLQDVDKIFKSITIFSDNLDSSALSMNVDYMTDDDASWTTITGDFDQAPSEEIDLSATNNVAGKRIKLRLRLRSTTLNLTPSIKALIVKMVAFVPIKYQYSMTVRVADRDADLYGVPLAQTTLDAINTQLNTWANTATPLTLRSVYSWADNVYVKLEPPSMLPASLDASTQQEVAVYSLVAVEL